MDAILESIQKLSTDLKRYVEIRTELLSLELAEKASNLISAGIWLIMIFLCFFLAAFFLLSTIAAYINHYFGAEGTGELVVSTLVLIVIGILFMLKSRLTSTIAKKVQNSILSNQTKTEDLPEATPNLLVTNSTEADDERAKTNT